MRSSGCLVRRAGSPSLHSVITLANRSYGRWVAVAVALLCLGATGAWAQTTCTVSVLTETNPGGGGSGSGLIGDLRYAITQANTAGERYRIFGVDLTQHPEHHFHDGADYP